MICEHKLPEYFYFKDSSQKNDAAWCPECGALWKGDDTDWRSPQDMSDLRRFQVDVYQNANNKGFWNENNPKWTSPAAKIALMHSELSEALEAYRHGNEPDEHCPLHTSAEVEFADCIIRILDFGQHHGMDVIGAMKAKHFYNQKRPYLHKKLG